MDENVKAVLQRIPADQLHTFNNHPFTVRRDEAMEKLVESVRVNGILNPVLVRPQPDGEYEIIAGHRRTEAGRILKLPYIPCFVCDLDDDHAIIAMIDSNLSQRENLPPSERAFALRMKAEAARRIMLAKKGRSENERATDSVAQDAGMSARQVSRFIKLTNLNRQLLNMLDAGKLGMEVGIELANLSTVEQCWIYDYINEHNMSLNIAQAKKLRQAIQQEGAGEKEIKEILTASAKPAKKNRAAASPSPTLTNGPAQEATQELRPVQAEQPHVTDDQPASVWKPEQIEAPYHFPVTANPTMSESNYQRIQDMFPPGTSSEAVCDSVCRVLEAVRGYKEYYPPDLPEAVILEDIRKMIHVKRPHIFHRN